MRSQKPTNTKRAADTAFPDAKTVRRVREKLSAKAYLGGNEALPENASETDRAKYQICQLIARYMREHGLSQRLLAKKLGVDEARISAIARGKVDSFTLDRLMDYAMKLYPGVRVEITAA